MSDNNNPQPLPNKEKVTTYSFRPRGEIKAFIDNLIKEKGAVSQALEHCVRLAMAASSGSPAQKPAPVPKPKPEPVPSPGGIVLTQNEIAQLEKIQKSKSKSMREAITYSIDYTFRNAWL